MNGPHLFTQTGADRIGESAWKLYMAMVRKFGDERAWEFVLNFYEGAGRNEKS